MELTIEALSDRENHMVEILYILAITSGLLGLGGLMLMGTPLSAESAPLLTARAVIAMAFVVIPYFTARAVESMGKHSQVDSSEKHREFSPRRTLNIRPIESAESFFDYFFMPGSTQDWQVAPKNEVGTHFSDDGFSHEKSLEDSW
jgi:hypothetical protein